MEKKISFEAAITRLDEIVRLLEQGDAPLDKSLTLFEEGTALIKKCGKELDSAEQKVVKLIKGPEGEPLETDFSAEE